MKRAANEISAEPCDGPEIITFGCRLNAYESEVMRGHAQAAGLNDAVIINTCAVTVEAERQARQAIRRARRFHPDAPIIVTGCAAQIDPATYAAMPEVSRVLGNIEKLDPTSFTWMRHHGSWSTTSWLCAKRQASDRWLRGPRPRHLYRCSRAVIIAARLHNPLWEGAKPFGSCWRGCYASSRTCRKRTFGNRADRRRYHGLRNRSSGSPVPRAVARRLLALVPDLTRLRLSSLDSVEIDEELMRLIAEEDRLMPHLHLSVQAGDDLILKRMKRRHSRGDVIDLWSPHPRSPTGHCLRRRYHCRVSN